MSQRFGRNRRRRAREEIAKRDDEITRLTTAQIMDRGLLRWQGDRITDLQQQIDDAKDILGPYCVAFKPAEKKLGGEPLTHVNVVAGPPRLTVRDLVSTEPPKPHEEYRHVRLPVMAAQCARSEVRFKLHALVKFGDDIPACYAVDEVAALQMSDRRLYEIIVENLAVQVLHAIKKPTRIRS